MDTGVAVGGFDYRSPRAHKARIGASLGGPAPMLLALSAILLALAGAYLLWLQWPIGWALIGLAAVPVMISMWKKGELDNLAVNKSSNSLDSVMAPDVLGLMPKQPSPLDVARVAGGVYGGHFFAARFGIGWGFLQQITSDNRDDTKELWEEALKIQKETGSHYVTAGVLVVALVRMHSNHLNLLAHLQLSIDDLIDGVRWQNHIDDLIDSQAKPRRTGGIARDWSFGWIPNLMRYGQNISQQIQGGSLMTVNLESHDDAISQISASLAKGGRGNAALVGPDGVGKTTLVYAFAHRLIEADKSVPKDLHYKQVFMLDAPLLISAAPGRGDLEGLVLELLGEAYSAKNIILCFDNAHLFFEEAVGSVDISNVLMPIVTAGNLPIILVTDEQRYMQIARRNSQLASGLNRVSIKQPNQQETMAILQDQLIRVEYDRKVTYMYQAVREAYRLSERYIHDLAMPGRAIKLLEAAADFADGKLVTASSVQRAIEKTVDVKVGIAQGDDEREKLLNLESLIHERMVNQSRAVQVVSDALRRARAGVRNEGRPIGTFMFLGPTGVGKTELAKALASVYFGGEDRIVRLDMNEFISPSDVERIIADPADDANSLTSRIMRQPFSVVLLDEIEKAHPNVVTTLLQVLDEGVLRDVRNREISFRDTIIIATSNAGADRIREHIARGIDIEKYEAQFIDELIDSNQFKSEFLNRFDEIVLFRPLNKDELLKVVDLMIAGVNKTLEHQKLAVEVSPEAKEYLVEAGYDPRMGARPMRRVVQRAVENIVARTVLAGAVEAGQKVVIGLEDVESIIVSRKSADEIAGQEGASE